MHQWRWGYNKKQSYASKTEKSVRGGKGSRLQRCCVTTFNFPQFNPDEENRDYNEERFKIELRERGVKSVYSERELSFSPVQARSRLKSYSTIIAQTRCHISLESLFITLRSYYIKKYCTLSERVMFTLRHRQEDESVCVYVNKLKSLARKLGIFQKND